MRLNFTKNQTKILGVFFSNPGASHYLRELARLLGKEPGVFQADINNLVARGVLVSERRAASRFFALDRNYPLYEELRSIFLKTTGAWGVLKKALGGVQHIRAAFVFGSWANAEEDAMSDIDLMIIGEPNENSLVAAIARVEKKLKRDVNYHIFSPDDWAKKNAESSSFLESILRRNKMFLIGDEEQLSGLNSGRPPKERDGRF